MSSVKVSPARFRRGDWVTFPFGVQPAFAQIIEDRGAIGVGGRRLYRVRVDQELDDPFSFEVPEEEMEKVVPDRAAIKDYLEQGGLLEILRANTQGGRPPRVWLTIGRRGEITHTFDAERGLIGNGHPVPFDGFLPHNRSKVLPMLQSFGLTYEEAEGIMESVGLNIP